ncbi:putative membrane protein YgcG [Actinopolyspora lacussalsi]|nr:putative membrane protein YgcG [Actinopolyspora lacussalsi]
MAREPSRAERNPTFIGSIDPFCWIAVVPLLMAALFVGLAIMPTLGLIMAVLGVLVLVLDGWINWRWHNTWGSRQDAGRGSARSGGSRSGSGSSAGRGSGSGRGATSGGRPTSSGRRPTAGRR